MWSADLPVVGRHAQIEAVDQYLLHEGPSFVTEEIQIESMVEDVPSQQKATQSLFAPMKADLQEPPRAPTAGAAQHPPHQEGSLRPFPQAAQGVSRPVVLGEVVQSPSSGVQYKCMSILGGGTHGICYLAKELLRDGEGEQSDESLYALKVPIARPVTRPSTFPRAPPEQSAPVRITRSAQTPFALLHARPRL